MATAQELEEKFWKTLKSDMTVMLGLDGVAEAYARPMTAQLDGDRTPIWFFTSKDSEIVQKLGAGHRAIATFASKDHDLFATVIGRLSAQNDRSVIDRLWNSFVAAWYEGGRDDPKLVLLRMDAEWVQIWENATTLFAGIKLMFGADPKEEYQQKVAKVKLASN